MKKHQGGPKRVQCPVRPRVIASLHCSNQEYHLPEAFLQTPSPLEYSSPKTNLFPLFLTFQRHPRPLHRLITAPTSNHRPSRLCRYFGAPKLHFQGLDVVCAGAKTATMVERRLLPWDPTDKENMVSREHRFILSPCGTRTPRLLFRWQYCASGNVLSLLVPFIIVLSSLKKSYSGVISSTPR